MTTHKVVLENYRFSGMDASLVGALKSVADYYRIPLTPSWIYGMTGIAFLHVLDERLVEPNGGPNEPDVFKLARHIGLAIEGIHAYAEGEDFTKLQAEARLKAEQALSSKQPVFGKHIDIGNQTSVIYAYDDVGYYTRTWHTGYEHSEDVIPWNFLGCSQCPCINCVRDRESANQAANIENGLVSLHWGTPIQPTDEFTALQAALAFVIRLNEQGSYRWSGKTYYVGSQAYKKWLSALENDEVDPYYFSLFIEILYEARSHAVHFLTELKEKSSKVDTRAIEEGIQLYCAVASQYKILKEMYPYEEPRRSEFRLKEQCMEILESLHRLERTGFEWLRKLYASLD